MNDTPQQYVDKNGQYVPQEQGVEFYIDTNDDGVVDAVVHSELGGETIEVLDIDYDGKADVVLDHGTLLSPSLTAYVDSDGDGTFDAVIEDIDGDGSWDISMIDSDGDGVYETLVDDGDLEG